MLKNCCGLSRSVHNVDRLKIKYLIAFLKLLCIILSVNESLVYFVLFLVGKA